LDPAAKVSSSSSTCCPAAKSSLPGGRFQREIFSLIRRSAGLEEISCYTRDELDKIFREAGGKLLESWSMKEMELARCRRNRYFPRDGLGWIECVMGRM
jgi:hypothetical protein